MFCLSCGQIAENKANHSVRFFQLCMSSSGSSARRTVRIVPPAVVSCLPVFVCLSVHFSIMLLWVPDSEVGPCKACSRSNCGSGYWFEAWRVQSINLLGRKTRTCDLCVCVHLNHPSAEGNHFGFHLLSIQQLWCIFFLDTHRLLVRF